MCRYNLAKEIFGRVANLTKLLWRSMRSVEKKNREDFLGNDYQN